MADKKPAAQTASKKPTSATELQATLLELRKELQEQLRSIKTGTATNVRVASQTRKKIARVLTQLKTIQKEGERK